LTAHRLDPRLAGLAAVLLWASLGAMAAMVSGVVPLQILAIAFSVGGLLSWLHRPAVRWRPLFVLAGCVGLFGSHLLYFVAMSLAPAAQVVVINYTWPLLMVLAAPLFRLPGSRWSPRVLAAAVIGFAAVVMLVWDAQAQAPHAIWGWAAAIGSAILWCGFSLAQASYKAFGDYPLSPAMLLSGVLSGAMLFASGGWITPTPADVGVLLMIGLGPMGAAFILWAMALRHGDAQWLGVIANISPVVSVALLTMLGFAEPSARLFWAAIGIAVAGLLIGARSGAGERNASTGIATGD
jgi:drug/metabolite transporter (DMT)-like permease